MGYKKKAALLLGLNLFLILLYGGTLFRSQKAGSAGAAQAWLEARFIPLADSIELYGAPGRVILSRKNNVWVMGVERDSLGENPDLPVRQIRVEELLRDLSRRKHYPLRSSASAPEKLGLGEGASRIIVRGGPGLPLLDLRIGFTDAPGRDVYLQEAGTKEIRSGEDIFTLYTESGGKFWYDLRLFPDLEAAMVQRIRFFMAGESPLTLSRKNNGWIDESAGTEVPGAEARIRLILSAQGEDFADPQPWEARGSVVLELGDGSSRTLRFGGARDSGIASVSGFPFTYVLPELTIQRFSASSFFPGERADGSSEL